MNEKWKRKLKDYYDGNLSDEEVKKIEEELEKLDIYQEYISEELGPTHPPDDHTEELPPEKVSKILRSSMRNVRFSLVAYVIMILLLIYPLLTLASFAYYGWGGKGNDLIDVAIETIYVTEPNVSLIGMEVKEDVGLFTLGVNIDLYKRVGRSDLKYGNWNVSYDLSHARFPDRHYITDSPPDDIPYFDTKKLFHPHAERTNVDSKAWQTLENLPNGTVAEVYISLNDLYPVDEMDDLVNGLDLEWRWYAIDTGFEASGKGVEGGYMAPIGYPAQNDPDSWSPYNKFGSNNEQFMNSLRFLAKYEEQAVNIARAKWLDLDERIEYLEENGLHAYGGVLTGPTKEILKMKEDSNIRLIHLGEVRLWDW
ncbi:MAG TPA: anti sigma factor C-terminal domain-containing protein [Virgibacillus sp.]|nr:anti sigma factor C-terminal domain-containing protein [Virgibacillus sp.]